MAVYLVASRLLGYAGFPLDDAWIHQTFARNLAERGEWAFVSGHPSGGSTAPLWTLILAVGYTLHLDYHAWTYLCGWATLALVAWVSSRIALRLRGDRLGATLAGVFVAVDWHLAWASVSGMETLLFTGLALLALEDCIVPDPLGFPGRERAYRISRPGQAAEERDSRSTLHALDIGGYLKPGLAAGLAILARPDGLTLLPWVVLGTFLSAKSSGWRLIPARLAALAAVAGLLFGGYLVFNYRLSGSLWPNTFYAKQAEYAVQRQAPFPARLARAGAAPMLGGLAVLAPGIVLSVISQARARQWGRLVPLGWALGFIGLYAWRLPVTYQHARYLMPAIPPLAIYGLDGLAGWARLNDPVRTRRIVSRAWALSVGAVTLAFWLIGAQRYGRDVRIIETEMVATARWLAANTPPSALIAVHDIGAVGYFSRRDVFDLAGLVSPDIIPVMRDEPALARLIVASGAGYLVTFPGWYPLIVADSRFQLVHSTGAPFGPAEGGENMGVYRVAPP